METTEAAIAPPAEHCFEYRDQVQLLNWLQTENRAAPVHRLPFCPRVIVFASFREPSLWSGLDHSLYLSSRHEGAEILIVPEGVSWREIKTHYRLYRLETVYRPEMRPGPSRRVLYCSYQHKRGLLQKILTELQRLSGRTLICCSLEGDEKRIQSELSAVTLSSRQALEDPRAQIFVLWDGRLLGDLPPWRHIIHFDQAMTLPQQRARARQRAVDMSFFLLDRSRGEKLP